MRVPWPEQGVLPCRHGPRVLVFDNATGVGHRRADGTVTQTRPFSLFCARYGFETRFCNPYSGWEKGSTENAVGFLRRNLMVPMDWLQCIRQSDEGRMT